MRIIQIIPTLGQGGAERFVVDLSNELANNGHDVLLIQLFPENSSFSFFRKEIHNNVKFISLNKRLGFDTTLLFRLNKLILKINPDIVHTHLEAISYIFPSLISKAKFFHTIHNQADKESSGLGRKIRQILFKSKLVKPITISKESEISFNKIYKLHGNIIYNGRKFESDSEKVNEIKNEISTYIKDNNTKVITLLARLSRQKRPYILAKVAKRLYNEGYNICVLIIGSYQDIEVKNEVIQVNSPCIHILGEKNNPIDYLKNSFVFCLCSDYEGLPISLIEAMHSGAIPVCTPVGGIVNLVKDGENGILSKDLSEDSYYCALKRLLDSDEETILKLKTNAQSTAKEFEIEICEHNYTKLYQS